MSAFTLDVHRSGAVSVVEVVGTAELSDAAKLSALLEELIGRGRHAIVLNLAKAEFLTSGIWGTMMAVLRRARRGGGDLVLSGLGASVQQSFDVLGLAPYLHVFPSEKAAVEAIASPSTTTPEDSAKEIAESQRAAKKRLVAERQTAVERRRKFIEGIVGEMKMLRSSLDQSSAALAVEEKDLAGDLKALDAARLDLSQSEVSVPSAKPFIPTRPSVSAALHHMHPVNVAAYVRWEKGDWHGYTSELGPSGVRFENAVPGLPDSGVVSIDLELDPAHPIHAMTAHPLRPEGGESGTLLGFDPGELDQVYAIRRFGREFLQWEI